jgi:hypothetical protein
VSIVRELEPAGVPEHVRVDGEGEVGLLADAAHELLEAGRKVGVRRRLRMIRLMAAWIMVSPVCGRRS